MAKGWFPFYWADYIVDTVHLTLAEHGAYLLLMGRYYQSGKPLPSDPKLLHACCICKTDFERAIVDKVVAEFFVLDGDVYRHKRIDLEIKRYGEISKSNKTKAKKGAAARWSGHAPSNASSIAQASPKQCLDMPNHNHNHNIKQTHINTISTLPPKPSPEVERYGLPNRLITRQIERQNANRQVLEQALRDANARDDVKRIRETPEQKRIGELVRSIGDKKL